MARHTTVPAVDLPVFIKQVNSTVFRIQYFHIRFPERWNRSYIFPVSVKVIRVHFSVITQKIRNDIISKIIFRLRIRFVFNQILLQNIPVKYVNSHRCQIRLRILRFFLEFRNTVIIVRDHKSESWCLLPRDFHNRHTEFCVLFFVESKKITIILLADLISRQNNDIFRIIALDK